MRNRTLLFFVVSSLLPACGGQTSSIAGESDSGTRGSEGGAASTGNSASEAGATSTGSGVSDSGTTIGNGALDAGPTSVAVPSSGSGSFTIMSDRPIAGSSTGSSYHLEASFGAGATTCETTTFGECTVNPCYGGGSSAPPLPLPNVGEIQFAGAQLAVLPLEPESNGSYTTLTVQGQVAWETNGESVSVAWAHAPGDATPAGGSMQLASPPYVALSAGSALGATPATLSRQQDLDLSWTSDSPPSGADLVLVDVTLGSTQVTCEFSAGAGAGTVPSAALQFLEAGTGTYDVHAKEYDSVLLPGVDGTTWPVGFNVDAHARAGGGLAYGAVTIE